MWLTKEGKYARISLKTTNRSSAIEKAKSRYHEIMAGQNAGKTYYSKTTKQGVEEYVKQREKDVEFNQIVKGRLGTIKTHLEHWLEFIGRDTKLKELERTDCENYFYSRSKNKKKIQVSPTTISNEQSTINAMMSWLYKRKETYIDGFDFKKLPKVDRGSEKNRRNTFTDEEIIAIEKEFLNNITEGKKDIAKHGNLVKILASYFHLITIASGLRKGEQIQLTWGDVSWIEKNVKDDSNDLTFSLVKLQIKFETTKVRKSRELLVKDIGDFYDLRSFQTELYLKKTKEFRKLNLLPHAKFVVLSNQNQKEDIAKAEEFKVDLFIVKALKTPSEVVQEINKII
jgi:hypothetical protein